MTFSHFLELERKIRPHWRRLEPFSRGGPPPWYPQKFGRMRDLGNGLATGASICVITSDPTAHRRSSRRAGSDFSSTGRRSSRRPRNTMTRRRCVAAGDRRGNPAAPCSRSSLTSTRTMSSGSAPDATVRGALPGGRTSSGTMAPSSPKTLLKSQKNPRKLPRNSV